MIRDPNDARSTLGTVAADKYSYREMDDFTDKIEKALKVVPQASKVRSASAEKVFLLYSQERTPVRTQAGRPAKHSSGAQHHGRRPATGSDRKEFQTRQASSRVRMRL